MQHHCVSKPLRLKETGTLQEIPMACMYMSSVLVPYMFSSSR
jgi:hypothetical protein